MSSDRSLSTNTFLEEVLSTSNIWWRRTGVAGLATALALGTTVLGGGIAAQAAPSSDDNTIVPVRGAIADSEDNTLGTITFDEDFEGQFFPGGATTTVTLTLSAGAEFSPGVTPTFTASSGYIINNGVQDEDQDTTDPAAATYTFTVQAPAVPKKATITVSGLKADVDAGTAPGVITLTSTPGDTNPAINILDFNRVGGQDRYETAQKLFQLGVGSGDFIADNVVLSGGEGYADALSANFLAGELQTGTLLTRSGFLSPETRQAIADAEVRKVYITGGTGAVSQKVEDALRNMRVGDRANGTLIQVVRLGGSDRYATNKKINEYVEQGFPAKSNTVLLASGEGFADALALGPVAYRENYPVILTRSSSLSADAQAQLDVRNPDNVVIAGGTSSISSSIESDLKKQNYDRVNRYGGADRTITAQKIADWYDRSADPATTGGGPLGDDFDATAVHIANGQGYADALAAGPVAGAGVVSANDTGNPILLAKSRTVLGTGAENFLGERSTDETQLIVALGLTGALAQSVVQDAANAVGAQPINPGPTDVAAGA